MSGQRELGDLNVCAKRLRLGQLERRGALLAGPWMRATDEHTGIGAAHGARAVVLTVLSEINFSTCGADRAIEPSS